MQCSIYGAPERSLYIHLDSVYLNIYLGNPFTTTTGVSVVAYCVRCSLRLRLRNEKILKIKIRLN